MGDICCPRAPLCRSRSLPCQSSSIAIRGTVKLCDMSSRVTGRAFRITEAEMAKWRGPYGTSCLLYPHSSPFENKLLLLQVDFVRLQSMLLGRIACTVVQM